MSSAEVQGVQSPASSEESASQRHETLLKDLQKQVALLEADLRERAAGEEIASSLLSEYQRADAEGRIGVGYETWLDDRLVQIAAAWVLACVFVRFSEDNGLIPDAWLSGPGERLAEAQDRHDDYFRAHPEHNDRDWLFEAFKALHDSHPTAAGLFDERFNPLWEVTPSYGAATRLLSFWRERDAEGQVRHDFTDPELDTRFLGDLYQYLSEHARKTYALLQTPRFVEKFILDLTLEPAVGEFGLDPVWKHRPEGWRGEIDEDGQVRGLRCIDPACGSGHFLLGLFERIFNKWRELEPGTDRWVLVRRALESVHGADKNPFAASIARFRLLVAALKEGGVRELRRAPAMPIRVAVGDSLLHGREAGQEADATFDDLARAEVFTYRTEDVKEYVREVDLLGRGSYHVVVANPPYITVKDKQENQNYRDVYWACSGKYALSVPFAQRIFELALRAGGSHQDGGFTGQITANSFMKREFGKVLIESFFNGGPYKDPKSKRKRDFGGVDLTHIIDTSGAYIEGHGTPTVILVGRNQVARQANPIRAVLGVRGEAEIPEMDSFGPVWCAITEQVREPGSESEWVSVEDAERKRFAEHPWSLSGGGAGSLMEAIERAASRRLSSIAESIGITSVTGEDDLYLLPRNGAAARLRVAETRPLVTGDVIRDYWLDPEFDAVWVYGQDRKKLSWKAVGATQRLLVPYRTAISSRKRFGVPMLERGMAWYEWQELYPSKLTNALSIAFAFVATHNHFVLDRGGKVFKQSAPVIKLPEGASEEQHLELMGVLNSSAACFWLKQVSQGKGGSGLGRGVQDEEWEERYEFTGTKLEDFPLPEALPLALARELDALAQELAECEPAAVSASCMPTRSLLDKASETQGRIRSRMIYLQEELDWTVYGAYGLLTAKEVAATTLPGMPADLNDDDVPQLLLGQRAFEMALKQKVDAGETETAWFGRHSSGDTAVSGVPAAWPDTYKKVVQARLDLIAANKDIRLLERPEYKRRWSTEPWAKREAAALRAWLLDATEREELWFGERGDYTAPRTLTVYQLADALRHDEDVQSVAALYAADHLKKPEASLATVLQAVIENEHVPYLAALRYKESGLRKRAQWERVWDQQREEDRTGERLDIKVPPKYSGADFLRHSYWSNRGKLDVPKERFISYPGASTDSDPSLLLGWAGWNHRDQAEALVNLISDRAEQDGWKREDPRFVPLLAGLLEVMPWVRQWYDEYDEEWGDNPAREFQTALNKGCADRRLSESDLRDWRPEKRRGGRSKSAE
ncbi:BREX-2 system adenine-specific DNA-methyltransferase PglX [Streptomyces coelicoflavus]|uniref:BREX-2 system adenine-specific DNA-methyltransferase PglX n=1 Tax=Streptomyces coelicoflavus TaxID=285562 RepID=UPI00210BE3B9|nr:BREX-2 system adenine-specific DNA-methyltransferase PglX [Streptomyces coelicoflavus]MCQ4200604.1 BREX-2 system adenine-specific DNA-methyltransferase PglX [Streptomyces coelicoflavus]